MQITEASHYNNTTQKLWEELKALPDVVEPGPSSPTTMQRQAMSLAAPAGNTDMTATGIVLPAKTMLEYAFLRIDVAPVGGAGLLSTTFSVGTSPGAGNVIAPKNYLLAALPVVGTVIGLLTAELGALLGVGGRTYFHAGATLFFRIANAVGATTAGSASLIVVTTQMP